MGARGNAVSKRSSPGRKTVRTTGYQGISCPAFNLSRLRVIREGAFPRRQVSGFETRRHSLGDRLILSLSSRKKGLSVFPGPWIEFLSSWPLDWGNTLPSP
jgi:hypothetical protein